MRRVGVDICGIWLLVYFSFIWVVVYFNSFRLERIDIYVKSVIPFVFNVYYWWVMVGGVIS